MTVRGLASGAPGASEVVSGPTSAAVLLVPDVVVVGAGTVRSSIRLTVLADRWRPARARRLAMRLRPAKGSLVFRDWTRWARYSGKRLTGTGRARRAVLPWASRRRIQVAMVAGLRTRRRAVAAAVQPRAALSSRMAKRSTGEQW